MERMVDGGLFVLALIEGIDDDEGRNPGSFERTNFLSKSEVQASACQLNLK
jgi:hypothetical protein